MTPELMDLELVEYSALGSVVDMMIYSPYMKRAITLRCRYSIQKKLTLLDEWPANLDAVVFALTDPECVDAAHEAIMYQRDCNRERN